MVKDQSSLSESYIFGYNVLSTVYIAYVKVQVMMENIIMKCVSSYHPIDSDTYIQHYASTSVD